MDDRTRSEITPSATEVDDGSRGNPYPFIASVRLALMREVRTQQVFVAAHGTVRDTWQLIADKMNKYLQMQLLPT